MIASTRVTKLIRRPLRTARQIRLALDAVTVALREAGARDRPRLTAYRDRAVAAYWSTRSIPAVEADHVLAIR